MKVFTQHPLDEVVPNPKGFLQGLFGSWIYPAKMPNDRSPILKPFGFLMETESNSIEMISALA
jgi:hypothetical protein